MLVLTSVLLLFMFETPTIVTISSTIRCIVLVDTGEATAELTVAEARQEEAQRAVHRQVEDSTWQEISEKNQWWHMVAHVDVAWIVSHQAVRKS